MFEGARPPADYGFTLPTEQIAYYEAAVRGSQAAFILAGVLLAQSTYEAEHDPLTGLYNRLGFMRAATTELAANPDGNYAFLMIDIGNLKAVNDKSAAKHDKGDEVIRAIAGQMRLVDRVVGRGGVNSDELFVLLNLDDVRDENRHLSQEERLAATIERFHQMGDDMRTADRELQQAQFFIAAGGYLPTGSDKRDAGNAGALTYLSMQLADLRLYSDKAAERWRLGFESYRH